MGVGTWGCLTLLGTRGVVPIAINASCYRSWWTIPLVMFCSTMPAPLSFLAAPCFVAEALAVEASTFLSFVWLNATNISQPKEHAILYRPFSCLCAIKPYTQRCCCSQWGVLLLQPYDLFNTESSACQIVLGHDFVYGPFLVLL